MANLKALHEENYRVKKIVAELDLDKLVLKEGWDFSKQMA